LDTDWRLENNGALGLMPSAGIAVDCAVQRRANIRLRSGFRSAHCQIALRLIGRDDLQIQSQRLVQRGFSLFSRKMFPVTFCGFFQYRASPAHRLRSK